MEDIRNDGAQFKPPSIVYWPAMMENFYGNPLYVQRPVAYAIRTDRAGTQTFSPGRVRPSSRSIRICPCFW